MSRASHPMLIKLLCRLPSSQFALSPLIPLIKCIHLLTRRHGPNEKHTKGKGQREGSWKYMIALGCAPNCRSTLIHSHRHPITCITPLLVRLIGVADINKHQADELGTTVQHDFIASHPGGIRNTISSKGKTTKSKKRKQRR